MNCKEYQFIEKEPGTMPRRVEGVLRQIKWVDETSHAVHAVDSAPSVLVANLPFRDKNRNETEPCPKCGTKRPRVEGRIEESQQLRTEGPSRKKSKTDSRIEEKPRKLHRVSRRKIKERENEDKLNNYLLNFKRTVAKYRPSRNRYAINRELDPQERNNHLIGQPKVGFGTEIRELMIISMSDTYLHPLVYIFFHRNFNWNLRNDGAGSFL